MLSASRLNGYQKFTWAGKALAHVKKMINQTDLPGKFLQPGGKKG